MNKLIIQASFFDCLDRPIFVKNREGVYIHCNDNFCNFVGQPKNNILGHTVYNIAPYELAHKYELADNALIESTKAQIYSSSVKTKAHFRKRVVFNKSVIYDSEGRVCGIIGIVSEVSHNVSQHNIATKKLTTRELEVLHFLIKGESVKSIALDMRISPHTAGGHMKSIYTKLDVHSKNEALYKALSLA